MLLWLREDVVDTTFVVTKKSLVQNWTDELLSHCHITPKILFSSSRSNSVALNSPVLIYVMNYEVIATNLDLIGQFLGTCRVGVILDESQKIKNPETKLSENLHSIAKSFARRVIMTGTPIANRPYDIWSQIKFLDDGKALGGSFTEFKTALDLPSQSSLLPAYGKRLEGIMEKIRDFSIRETKRTAGIVLPNKEILSHFVDLSPRQSRIYAAYRDEMRYELQNEKDDDFRIDDAEEVLKRLLRLVQCACNPILLDREYNEIPSKYSKLMELLGDIGLDSNKVIIWSGFIDNINWLNEQLDQFMPQKVHGHMAIADRNEAIRKFKTEKECRILLATPGTAKEGLTLTVAHHAIFFDRGFSLDDYIQAQDRIHRISQTEDCFVHNLIARNTIDEWVDSLLHAKYQAAQLAQGDISRKEFDVAFAHDLSGMLSELLSINTFRLRGS